MTLRIATLIGTCIASLALAARAPAAPVTSEPQTFVFIVGGGTANPYPGRTAFAAQHVDLAVPYASSGWDLHWHDEDRDLEVGPDEGAAVIPDAALLTRPAGSQWDFTGVAAGGAFHVLPQARNPAVLFLGIGTEEDDGALLEPWDPGDPRSFGEALQTRVNLVSVAGPGGGPATGAFSVWQAGAFGTTVFMSSVDGIGPDDALFVASGGHAHFNYGFAAPGVYEVTLTATTAVIPEPATAGLAVLAAAGWLLPTRRRRRSA